jgi:hypothetical protein
MNAVTRKQMEGGRWRIFVPPKTGYHYCCGIDAASGKEGANESVANFLCIETGEQVAILAGKVNPEDMAIEAEKAGILYNYAELAPEREQHGMTIITTLRERNYPNMFFHDEDLTAMGGSSRVWGWDARKYRNTAIDWLQQDIGYYASLKPVEREKSLTINDKETLAQHRFFIRNKTTGKWEATPGKYDDRVSAMYISNFIRRLRMKHFFAKKTEKKQGETYLDVLARGINEDDEDRSVDFDE